MVIQAQSSGFTGQNYAQITINDIPVQVEKNTNGHDRGLHIVVINPGDGHICLAKAFDTY